VRSLPHSCGCRLGASPGVVAFAESCVTASAGTRVWPRAASSWITAQNRSRASSRRAVRTSTRRRFRIGRTCGKGHSRTCGLGERRRSGRQGLLVLPGRWAGLRARSARRHRLSARSRFSLPAYAAHLMALMRRAKPESSAAVRSACSQWGGSGRCRRRCCGRGCRRFASRVAPTISVAGVSSARLAAATGSRD
jgi:hypothetical protein